MEQSIINKSQYQDFMRVKKPGNRCYVNNSTPNNKDLCYPEETLINDDVKSLKEHLFKEGKGDLLLWLQKIVIEACFVKLILSNTNIDTEHIMEPSIYYYTRTLYLHLS